MKSRSLAYVGLAFVALSGGVALNVISHVEATNYRMLNDMHASLPLAMRLAHPVGLRVIVCCALVLAVAIHRHERAVPILIILGVLQLAIAAAFVVAMWLPFSGYFGTSPPMQR